MERRYNRQEVRDASALQRAAWKVAGHPSFYTGVTEELIASLTHDYSTHTEGDDRTLRFRTVSNLAALAKVDIPAPTTRRLAAELITARPTEHPARKAS